MSGRAGGNGGAKLAELRAVSHFMKPSTAVALLLEQHGEAIARKIALTEQRRARRARSKKRFEFWAAVGARIEGGNCNSAANTRPIDRVGAASRT